MAARSYSSTFKRHLSFFDADGNGIITPYDSLRSALSLGLDFPVACLWVAAVPLMYGNTRLYTSVRVAALHPSKERSMLEGYPVKQDTYTRQDIQSIASKESKGLIDWLHIFNLWTLAADTRTGLVSKRDFELFQKGELLDELKQRRKTRQDVLPFLRGGPISVTGHSWFVRSLFGVHVYEDKKRD